METYIVWLDILQGNLEQSITYECTGRVLIDCPVDVSMYDSNGTLVSKIVNNQVVTANGPLCGVDGDLKYFFLGSDSYRFEIVGNDTGTMEVTVEHYDGNLNVSSRQVYQELPVTDGVGSTLNFTASSASLKDSDGKTITPDYDLDADDIDSLEIQVTVTGNGSVLGDGSYSPGDKVVLFAEAEDGSDFDGWYSDGQLLSSEAEYSFVCTASRTIEARFVETTEAPIPANAHGNCGKSVKWSIDADLTLTISGTGAMKDYDDSHESPWKQYNVRKVVIEPGVTHIGNEAFYWCESITNISMPNTVTSLGDWAFAGCTGLTSVTIPGSVTSFGYSAFIQCYGLTSVTISDGVTSIDGFDACTSLKTITIPASVTSIGDNNFQDYNYTTNRYEPIPGVTIIGYTNSAAHRYAVEKGFSFRSLSTSIKGAVLNVASQTYTGKPIIPAVTLRLNGKTLCNGTDYTVTCTNNKDAGKATIKVTGKGKYVGTVSSTFSIHKAKQTLTVTPASVLKGKTATLSVKDDYGKLTFASSNQKVATVTAKGVVKGLKAGTVIITVKAAGDKNHEAATQKVKITVYAYATPSISKVENVNGGVKITAGKVSGAAKYRFFYKTGKGNWTKLADTTSTSFTWKKATNGTKYSFTVRCISKDGKTYTSDQNNTGKTITYVAAPTLSSVKNTKAKTATVAWKKLTGITGFQIQYSTSKTFASGNKTVTVKKAVATSQAITRLTKGKTYYFRIRSYKTVSGKAVYSGWSAAKALKITQ